jgi:hypothetical protein
MTRQNDDTHMSSQSHGSSALERHGIEPDPVIEAYKKDVDRTLLRENLKLTVDERVQKMISALRFAEAVRQSRRVPEPR